MLKGTCPHCQKEIEAYNQKHLDQLMQVHIFSKHKPMMEARR